MKKLMIIRTGATYDSIKMQFGDFDECIIRATGLNHSQIIIWSAFEDPIPPSMDEIGGIVITGSHAMVSHKERWSESLASWLREIDDRKIPTLGICYGHQLIAHAFGGVVDYHPHGEEMGTTGVTLTNEGKTDLLLSVLSSPFHAHVAHSQSVLTLPPKAKCLATSDFEPHHSFCLNDHLWGVQFHPEFNAGVVRAYMEKNGRSKEALLKHAWEHEDGIKLMRQFVKIIYT